MSSSVSSPRAVTALRTFGSHSMANATSSSWMYVAPSAARSAISAR